MLVTCISSELVIFDFTNFIRNVAQLPWTVRKRKKSPLPSSISRLERSRERERERERERFLSLLQSLQNKKGSHIPRFLSFFLFVQISWKETSIIVSFSFFNLSLAEKKTLSQSSVFLNLSIANNKTQFSIPCVFQSLLEFL